MVRVPFVKMHGLGNDFVLIDDRVLSARALDPSIIDAEFARKACDRRFGVGADQLLRVREAFGSAGPSGGSAGPSGGSAEKPVGMVCFAWAGREGGCEAQTRYFPGERGEVRAAAVRHALLGLLLRVQTSSGIA